MRKTLPFAILMVLSFLSTAQNGGIKGFVYNSETGEPVSYASVVLKDTNASAKQIKSGVATDANGFFMISQLRPQVYLLQVSFVGYAGYTEIIEVTSDKIITKKINLQATSISLSGVEISATREERKTETQVSVEKITTREIKQMPAIGGQGDLAQYLQVLPGITFTGDQGGQLFIRGGSMIQNKLLLDGMIVYNPFHSIGLFSVLETDIISNADIYTGGFGAEYGGRVSSIMDITTRDGNKRRLSGKVGVSTFGANLMLEGPIKKATEKDPWTASFLVSAKNSYLKQTSEILYPYIEGGLPYNFFDFYGKFNMTSENGSKLNVFGFAFTDNVDNYKSIANYNWQNYGMGANFVVLSGSNSLLEGLISYSTYGIEMQEANESTPRKSSIGGLNLGLYISNFFGNNRLKYGFDVETYSTTYSFMSNIGGQRNFVESTGNTNELSAFATFKWIIGRKLIIEPGVRLIYYSSLQETSFEPRLAIKYNATDKFRIKLAGGFYSQNIFDTKSDRDIVNLFTGYLSSIENLGLVKTFKGEGVKGYLQKSQHAILGFEYDFIKYTTLNIEGYYKYFPQLIGLNRNKMYNDVPEYREDGAYPKPEYLYKDFIVEEGNAYGLDVSLKYDYDRYYVWVAYSLGFVTRQDELITYNPYYDRRHNLNVVLSYSLGQSKDWEFGLRWNLGSGFPYTQTQGGFEGINFLTGIGTDYTTQNGTLGIFYADYNKGRLPIYHRLDIMVKKKFSLGKRSILEANFTLTNVYNRANIFYFDRVTYQRVDQLPIMPSIGVVWTF